MSDPNAELIVATYEAVQLALAGFVKGMGPTLTVADGAKILLSASASLMAAHVGRDMTATALRSLADTLGNAGVDPRELN